MGFTGGCLSNSFLIFIEGQLMLALLYFENMYVSDLTLPPFAFMDASDHDEQYFRVGREMIIHTPTLTILEVFDVHNILIMGLPAEAQYLDFNFYNTSSVKEQYRVMVHVTLHEENRQVMLDCAKWYTEYLGWYGENS